MFSQDQDIVDKLLEENDEFNAMYQKHDELNALVDKANCGEDPLCQDAVHNLKKEKLLLRDKLAVILAEYKQQVN